MKKILFLLPVALLLFKLDRATASFSGSTYTMDSPFSLFVASGDVTISSVTPAAAIYAVLIVSNSAATSINVNWAAGGRAIGSETTNQVSVPRGKVVEITVDAALPNILTYTTRLEHDTPAASFNGNDIIPELLYFKLMETNQTAPPFNLADSSLSGTNLGAVASAYAIAWVPNQLNQYQAMHFNGFSTTITVTNQTAFNFTTNLFSINMWVRPLTYHCQLAGNGQYLISGWYFVVNQVGAVLLAAENPGLDSYVATGASVVSVGQWCMLTLVRTDTSTVLIYKNAVQQPTIGSFANPAPCADSLIFGRYPGGGYYYDGDMGTVRIYNRALSPTEINTLYTNSATGITP